MWKWLPLDLCILYTIFFCDNSTYKSCKSNDKPFLYFGLQKWYWVQSYQVMDFKKSVIRYNNLLHIAIYLVFTIVLKQHLWFGRKQKKLELGWRRVICVCFIISTPTLSRVFSQKMTYFGVAKKIWIENNFVHKASTVSFGKFWFAS